MQVELRWIFLPQRRRNTIAANGIPKNCCERPFVLHVIDNMLDDLEHFMAKLNAKCPCRGVVYMETGLHVLFDRDVERKYGTGRGGRRTHLTRCPSW